MLALKNLLASAVLATVMPTIAAPIFLDFEDSPLELALVGNTYEKKFGVVFTDNAYSLHSYLSVPPPISGGNFYRPSSKAALGLFSTALAESASFYINVAAGFGETFKFLYTTTELANTANFVNLYSGENGTGSLIRSTTLDRTNICANNIYCNWDEAALDFTGTVKSVLVSGRNGGYFFDNMTFGPLASPPPGTDLPEPGGIALSLAALGALAWTRKRSKR